MKHKFEHQLYNISTDYDLLWKLINEGNRIPAWVLPKYYNKDYLAWDVVEVSMFYDNYFIQNSSRSYQEDIHYQGFIEECNMLCLHFIKL